eukprot:TRINITY_DN303_c0_g1_i6.p1 TRINITY_DN303_c0_g1~~TRINITY_DN303_c0_g1_i6.p1  ORF type:complete len:253 (+),score=72.72 TRINITY_DN303_c0_g1_i6:423-1181(+)
MAVMHPASQEKSQTTRTTPPSITITMSTTFLNARVLNKVAKELYTFQEKPVEGLSVSYDDEDMSEIYATIDGPMDTPFEGGQFKMKLTLGSDFPSAPPKGFFQTKIFHPNVSTQGEICINTLKKDWKPELGLTHVFLTVKCLLINPNPESALNEDAGRLFMEDYEEYAKVAALWTSVHAQPSKLSKGGKDGQQDDDEQNSSNSTSTTKENETDNQSVSSQTLSVKVKKNKNSGDKKSKSKSKKKAKAGAKRL